MYEAFSGLSFGSLIDPDEHIAVTIAVHISGVGYVLAQVCLALPAIVDPGGRGTLSWW